MKIIVSFLLTLVFSSPLFAADLIPPVYLNHFYVALDEASFDALRKSPQVQALAHVVERHTVAGKDEWTGFYVQGRQTYMEFFGSGNFPEGMHLGDSGLGLSVERAGGVAAIADRLRTVYKKVEISTTPRTTATGTIPWFISAQVKSDQPESMETWVMENDPNYLAAVHPGDTIKDPFSREQSLSWYFLPERQLDDIIGVTAALKPAEIAQLSTELKLVGWSLRTRAQGFVAKGPDKAHGRPRDCTNRNSASRPAFAPFRCQAKYCAGQYPIAFER